MEIFKSFLISYRFLAKRSLLHWLLVFVNQWNNGRKMSPENVPNLRHILCKAVDDAEGLPFPDSTAARLSLLLEINNDSGPEVIS